jgi:spore coat protein U-like protein
MRHLHLAILGLAFLAPTAALAATATSNMAVSATVSDNCTISAGALAFGAYDTVSGTAVDGTANVTVACTLDSVSTITLGQGANADAGSTDAVPLRRMTDGTDFLTYGLFQEAGHVTLWGNTDITGQEYTALSSDPTDLIVYGTIDGAQSVPAGAYTDTVVATITF